MPRGEKNNQQIYHTQVTPTEFSTKNRTPVGLGFGIVGSHPTITLPMSCKFQKLSENMMVDA